MQNPDSKPKSEIQVRAPLESVPNRDDVNDMVEALFDVLDRHGATGNEGVLALLTSFVETSSKVLGLSSEQDVEHNRNALLEMLEHARRSIDTWSVGGSSSGYVH